MNKLVGDTRLTRAILTVPHGRIVQNRKLSTYNSYASSSHGIITIARNTRRSGFSFTPRVVHVRTFFSRRSLTTIAQYIYAMRSTSLITSGARTLFISRFSGANFRRKNVQQVRSVPRVIDTAGQISSPGTTRRFLLMTNIFAKSVPRPFIPSKQNEKTVYPDVF